MGTWKNSHSQQILASYQQFNPIRYPLFAHIHCIKYQYRSIVMDASSGLYWLETWNAQISTIVGAFCVLCGLFALFAAGASCKIAGLIQIVAGLAVVAVEGPQFLPQLAMLAPTGAFFEAKAPWIKVAFYAALTVVPAFTGCFKTFLLGFIASAVVTVIHALLLFNRRDPSDEMNFQNNGDATGVVVQPNDQAHSPASP